MKLTIGPRIVEKVKYRNVFVFELGSMSGDADAYDEAIVEVKPDNPFLGQFAADMFRSSSIGGYEMDGDRYYKQATYFTRWFDTWRTDKLKDNPSYNPDIDNYDDPNFISIEWPSDVIAGDGRPSGFTGADVVYYDENGDKFKVILETEEGDNN